MKKMSFTSDGLKNWLSNWGKLTFLVLFALCVAGVGNLDAQTAHPVGEGPAQKGKLTQKKLDPCSGANEQYTDDNTVDNALYSDFAINSSGANNGARRDTVEFCPQDIWHTVTVTFTEFDINTDDRLRVIDGSVDSLKAGNVGNFGDGTITPTTGLTLNGSGVSAANGGWVAASCSPEVNPSGCLTFIFETDTNADDTKGLGWDAWVTCADRKIELKDFSVASQKIECNATNLGLATVSIPTPTVSAGCGTLTNPGLTLRVRNQAGETCNTTVVNSGSAATAVTLTGLAIGNYTAEWFLTADPTKTTGVKVFSISLPALVCNDEVEVPLGSGCSFEIDVDDILENPCDTAMAEYLSYHVTVQFGEGKNAIITGSGTSVKSAWPELTKDLLQAYATAEGKDLPICGAEAKVTIERLYRQPTSANCGNGNVSATCETTIRFSDETAPIAQITNIADVDTLKVCQENAEAMLRSVLKVGGVDNCRVADTTLTIVLEETDPCYDANGALGKDTTRAFLTVSVTDMCGNRGIFQDTAILIRPDEFADPRPGRFECDESGEATEVPGVVQGIVKDGGFTPRDTVALSETVYICGYILSAERAPLPATDCGDKEFITWSVLDWCDQSSGLTRIDTQFVEYIDTKAPFFTDTLVQARATVGLPSSDADEKTTFKRIAAVDIELGAFSCTYDINNIARPAAGDNCDANPDVSIMNVYRIEDAVKWVIPQSQWATLDCDSFCVRWKAEDECHEQQAIDQAFQIVVIKDVTKPSAVCVDQLNISLPDAAGARVRVEDVDAGSYDACGIKSRLIRIKDSGQPWAEVVEISCEYVHPDLQIELQIIDNKDNENICWLDVVVEDKIDPICQDLDPVTRFCDEFHNGELGASTDADGDGEFEAEEWQPLTGDLLATYQEEFGSFVCDDNLSVAAGCGTLERVEEYQLIEWPCGQIEIRRRHKAIDWSGNESDYVTQDVTVEYRPNWVVTLPADWEGSCGDEVAAPAISVGNGSCDLLGYEVTSRLFEVPGDACFKMERTYHIINWCTYQAGQDPVEIARIEGDHGVAEGQTITSADNAGVGYFTYVQILKVHDDEGPVVTIQDPTPCINGVDFDAAPYGEEDITPGTAPFECDEEKTWIATATDCSDESAISWEGRLYDAAGNIVATSTTNTITYVVSNKETLTAEFWAFDGCGNSSGERGETITFWDCKAPTPYLLNGVAVELMETGVVSIWASDLDQGTFDNCTDQDRIDLRIWHETLGDAPTDDAGVLALPQVIEFGCLQLGTQNVNIYAIDEEGNWDFAVTYVNVQDNMGVCPSDPVVGNMVAGAIVNANGEDVQSVAISVNGADQRTMTTAADGKYEFMLSTGGDYTITPEKDINPLNGVSTFDLVLISKHILGITPFDSPYKYIAADVNKSGSITAFDMVQLRQLILNITSEFPNNSSWRFVERDYEFTSANPAAESFNEFISINNLDHNMNNMDFTAVKVGDVNGNALANSLVASEARTTNGTLNINVADRFVEAGQTVTVDFAAADMAAVQGYQFTLNFAGLELAELNEGVAKAANFNTNLANRGMITTSWNGEANDEVLFTLKLTAQTSGLLSELVSVSSDVTPAEAYNTAGELMNVNIDFSTATAAGFGLNQNTPNPFNGETVIGFNLPQAATATLTVMDVQGKVLRTIKGDYDKGYNQVSLRASELGATGVLYYQLESADNVATKKMIIIE